MHSCANILCMEKSNDYFKQRNIECIKKIREVEKDLPHFIPEYFIGVEHNTSALTRLNYAYDLRIFFYYLVNYVATFQDVGSPQNFTIDDLKKVTTTHLERYTDFLTYYEYNGKTYTQTFVGARDVQIFLQ